MAAQSVDRIDITDWSVTGRNVQIPQYQFTLEIWWTDSDGLARHQPPQVYQYPNDISAMPLNVRKAFANAMIVATVRVTLGIDTWEQHS